MSVKILIFEDDVYIANEISIRLKNVGYQDIDIAVTKDQAFRSIKKVYPDIAILDIRDKTDDEAGIKIAKYLRNENSIPIIYFTANPTDKTHVYSTRPNAFIEKPNYTGVIHAIDLAVRNFHEDVPLDAAITLLEDPHYFTKDYLFILKKGLYYKVKHQDILYVTSDSGCIFIYTSNDTYSCSSTLKRFVEQINTPIFIRIHKSFLINFEHIDSFNSKQVSVSGKEIPMSKAGYEKLLNVVQKLKSK